MSNIIVKGTTPTLRLNFQQDLSAWTYEAAFSTGGRSPLVIKSSRIICTPTATGSSVMFTLTQAETLSLKGNTTELQLRAINSSGTTVGTVHHEFELINAINNNITKNGSGLVMDHTVLINRDYPDQHPMSAITDLTDALAEKEEIENKVIEWSATLSDTNYPSEKLVKESLDAAATVVNTHIANVANPHNVTKAQVGLSDVVNKPMDSTPTANSENYITSGGVKSYVDTAGGKIDTITVNGQQSPLPIENKNVTVPKVKKNGIDITLTNNAFDVIVPTKTSDITNDSDYQTGTQVSSAISTHNTSISAHDDIRQSVTSESQARAAADSELSDAIDAEELARTNADTSLQNQINTLKAIGRYLSNWNSATGLPTTNPPGLNPGDTYTYKTGDYYLVNNVAAAGSSNYRPNGTSYVVGTASTTVETAEVSIGDYYVFDSANWILLSNSQKVLTFANIAGDPYDNDELSDALDEKQDELVSGTNIKTINNNDILGSGNIDIDALPSQSGQAGKFLTTNGTTASWGDITLSNMSYGAIITDSSHTGYHYVHNLNTTSLIVQIADVNGDTVLVDVTRDTNNLITITFSEAPGTDIFYVYCIARNTTTIPSGEEEHY